MGILLQLLVIQVMIVFVLDLSGFVDDGIQPFFRKHLGGNLKSKPWLCSLCQTHHICLLYIIFTGQFSLYLWGYICLLAWLTPVTKDILILLREFILKALDAISIYFNI